MTQLKHVVSPFGEVNVHPGPGGGTRVWASILMAPEKEGAQTGIALDGSGSMRRLYGQSTGRVVAGFPSPKVPNIASPIAQKLCSYLARKVDADGGTTCIYWATGPNGSKIEIIGDLSADQAERHVFLGPQDFGTGTQLLPPLRYFVERFHAAPWGFYVFVTDGELFDLNEVKAYSVQLARDIASGRRRPLKCVLIGLGTDVNERQMEELDDLDAGVDVDIWDHKLAIELDQLERIFAEVVDRNVRVADHGRILDSKGRVVRDYRETGLPSLLQFLLPAGCDRFTLEVGGQRFVQPLAADAEAIPVVVLAAEDEIPTVVAVEEPPPAPASPVQAPPAFRPATAPTPPTRPIAPPVVAVPEPTSPPVAKPVAPPSPPPPATVAPLVAKAPEVDPEHALDNLDDVLAKSLDLQFADPNELKGVDLDFDDDEKKK